MIGEMLMYCTARATQQQVGDASVSLCLFTASVSVTTPIRTVQSFGSGLGSSRLCAPEAFTSITLPQGGPALTTKSSNELRRTQKENNSATDGAVIQKWRLYPEKSKRRMI